MEESVTYQAILHKGRIEGARRYLLLLGEQKFGPPDAGVRTSIETISDIARLEELAVRWLSASSWAELLAPPVRHRSCRRRSRGE